MSADPSARILTIAGIAAPVLDETAFVAAGAVIVGDVTLAAGSSVWYRNGLAYPRSLPADSFASAVIAAISGAAALVPPTIPYVAPSPPRPCERMM